jgi:hypothetical protein
VSKIKLHHLKTKAVFWDQRLLFHQPRAHYKLLARALQLPVMLQISIRQQCKQRRIRCRAWQGQCDKKFWMQQHPSKSSRPFKPHTDFVSKLLIFSLLYLVSMSKRCSAKIYQHWAARETEKRRDPCVYVCVTRLSFSKLHQTGGTGDKRSLSLSVTAFEVGACRANSFKAPCENLGYREQKECRCGLGPRAQHNYF